MAGLDWNKWPLSPGWGIMRILRAKPWEVAERLTEETGKKVISAPDGMTLEIDKAISG
jgi:hypothetical protein